MPEWFILIVGVVLALQTFSILGAISGLITAWRRKVEAQTEALNATIEYQNIIWLAAMEKEAMPPSCGKN